MSTSAQQILSSYSAAAASNRASGLESEDRVATSPSRKSTLKESWTMEERMAYLTSLHIVNMPGEEPMLHFLCDSIGAAPLPAPWIMRRDPKGRLFFANQPAEVVSWNHPLEPSLRELAGAFRVCLTLNSTLRRNCITSLRDTWEQEAKAEFAKWYSVKHESGRAYYCHRETGEAMWEHPAEVVLPAHYLKLKSIEWLLDDAYFDGLLAGSTEQPALVDEAVSSPVKSDLLPTADVSRSTRGATPAAVKSSAPVAISSEAELERTIYPASPSNARKGSVQSDLDAIRRDLEQQLHHAVDSQRALQRELSSLESDLKAAKESGNESRRQAKQAEEALAQEQQRVAHVKAECAELTRDQAHSRASQREADHAREVIERKLTAMSQELIAKQAIVAQHEQTEERQRSEHSELSKGLEMALEQMREAQQAKANLQAKLDEISNKSEETWHAERARLSTGLETALKRMEETQQAKADLQARLDEVLKNPKEISWIESEMNAAKEASNQSRWEAQQAEAALAEERLNVANARAECAELARSEGQSQESQQHAEHARELQRQMAALSKELTAQQAIVAEHQHMAERRLDEHSALSSELEAALKQIEDAKQAKAEVEARLSVMSEELVSKAAREGGQSSSHGAQPPREVVLPSSISELPESRIVSARRASAPSPFRGVVKLRVALWDFDPASVVWPTMRHRPIPLKTGQLIQVTAENDSDWAVGNLLGMPEVQGYFPMPYTAAVPESSSPQGARRLGDASQSAFLSLHEELAALESELRAAQATSAELRAQMPSAEAQLELAEFRSYRQRMLESEQALEQSDATLEQQLGVAMELQAALRKEREGRLELDNANAELIARQHQLEGQLHEAMASKAALEGALRGPRTSTTFHGQHMPTQANLPPRGESAGSVSSDSSTVRVALYNFDPTSVAWPFPEQPPLPLTSGLVIRVTSSEDSDWALGHVAGKPEEEGYFPLSYTAKVSEYYQLMKDAEASPDAAASQLKELKEADESEPETRLSTGREGSGNDLFSRALLVEREVAKERRSIEQAQKDCAELSDSRDLAMKSLEEAERAKVELEERLACMERALLERKSEAERDTSEAALAAAEAEQATMIPEAAPVPEDAAEPIEAGRREGAAHQEALQEAEQAKADLEERLATAEQAFKRREAKIVAENDDRMAALLEALTQEQEGRLQLERRYSKVDANRRDLESRLQEAMSSREELQQERQRAKLELKVAWDAVGTGTAEESAAAKRQIEQLKLELAEVSQSRDCALEREPEAALGEATTEAQLWETSMRDPDPMVVADLPPREMPPEGEPAQWQVVPELPLREMPPEGEIPQAWAVQDDALRAAAPTPAEEMPLVPDKEIPHAWAVHDDALRAAAPTPAEEMPLVPDKADNVLSHCEMKLAEERLCLDQVQRAREEMSMDRARAIERKAEVEQANQALKAKIAEVEGALRKKIKRSDDSVVLALQNQLSKVDSELNVTREDDEAAKERVALVNLELAGDRAQVERMREECTELSDNAETALVRARDASRETNEIEDRLALAEQLLKERQAAIAAENERRHALLQSELDEERAYMAELENTRVGLAAANQGLEDQLQEVMAAQAELQEELQRKDGELTWHRSLPRNAPGSRHSDPSVEEQEAQPAVEVDVDPAKAVTLRNFPKLQLNSAQLKPSRSVSAASSKKASRRLASAGSARNSRGRSAERPGTADKAAKVKAEAKLAGLERVLRTKEATRDTKAQRDKESRRARRALEDAIVLASRIQLLRAEGARTRKRIMQAQEKTEALAVTAQRPLAAPQRGYPSAPLQPPATAWAAMPVAAAAETVRPQAADAQHPLAKAELVALLAVHSRTAEAQENMRKLNGALRAEVAQLQLNLSDLQASLMGGAAAA